MIRTRSQTASTSGRMCVERSTARSRPRARIISRILMICVGSSPTVGSSRIRTGGWWTRAPGQRRPLPVALREVVDLAAGHFLEQAPLDRLDPRGSSPRSPRRPPAAPGRRGTRGRASPDRGPPTRAGSRATARACRECDHDVVARDPGRAGRRRQEAGQHPHGRRLPGAVGAEEPDDLPLLHRKGDVRNGRLGRIGLGEVLNFDHRIVVKKAPESSMYSRKRAFRYPLASRRAAGRASRGRRKRRADSLSSRNDHRLEASRRPTATGPPHARPGRRFAGGPPAARPWG